MASVADRAFGVGRAISEDLKSAGYTVVINCASNDETVAKYKSDTEIPNYTFFNQRLRRMCSRDRPN